MAKIIHTNYEYTKAERFAVVRKLVENKRYYCNFKVLYETKEAALAEALRMAGSHGGRFYVIEIQSITNSKVIVKAKKGDGK